MIKPGNVAKHSIVAESSVGVGPGIVANTDSIVAESSIFVKAGIVAKHSFVGKSIVVQPGIVAKFSAVHPDRYKLDPSTI